MFHGQPLVTPFFMQWVLDDVIVAADRTLLAGQKANLQQEGVAESEATVIRVLDTTIGDGGLTVMAGPCSIESREQLLARMQSALMELQASRNRARTGPDGALYVLEYGDGYFGENPDAQLSRIDFIGEGGERAPPVAAIC